MARTALEFRLSRIEAARPAAKIPPWCDESANLTTFSRVCGVTSGPARI